MAPRRESVSTAAAKNGRYLVPSPSIIRDVLIRVDPVHLDRALQRWNQAYGKDDQSLAIDGKTMRNAIDEEGHQTHIMSVRSVAQKMRELTCNVRLVFDFLRMTKNSCASARP